MRGRKPKPAHLKTGHANRPMGFDYNTPEPPTVSGAEQMPPDYELKTQEKEEPDKDAIECWEWLQREVSWVSRVDLQLLEQYCRVWSTWKKVERVIHEEGIEVVGSDGRLYPHHLFKTRKECLELLLKMQAMIGLSPADRSRIKAPKVSGEEEALKAFREGA